MLDLLDKSHGIILFSIDHVDDPHTRNVFLNDLRSAGIHFVTCIGRWNGDTEVSFAIDEDDLETVSRKGYIDGQSALLYVHCIDMDAYLVSRPPSADGRASHETSMWYTDDDIYELVGTFSLAGGDMPEDDFTYDINNMQYWEIT